jgi:hypothetical protein
MQINFTTYYTLRSLPSFTAGSWQHFISNIFDSRSWLLSRDSSSIGRHFHCQILAAPCSADDITTLVAMLAAWVDMQSQEAQGLPK